MPPPICSLGATGCLCRDDMCLSPGAVCVPQVGEDLKWCVDSAAFGVSMETSAAANVTAMLSAMNEATAAPASNGVAGTPCNDDATCDDLYDTCHPAGYLDWSGGETRVCLSRFSGKVKPSEGQVWLFVLLLSLFLNRVPPLQTVIFNMFVWMCVFNEFNARILDNSFFPTAGLSKNWLFWFLIILIAVVQTLMTVFGGAFTQTVSVSDKFSNNFTYFFQIKLNGKEWAGCLLFAVLVLPFGALLRQIPLPKEDDDEQHELRHEMRTIREALSAAEKGSSSRFAGHGIGLTKSILTAAAGAEGEKRKK